MQNKRRYVNLENGSHFICSFNLNNPETTVCIVFKMTNIASGDQLFVIIIHQSIVYELLSNLIGSLLLYYDFILH